MTAAEGPLGNPRRASILEAAAEVLARYGLRKTSMDDLARAAGLSRQGLYLHFSTKDELFRAAAGFVGDNLAAACLAALSQADRSLLDRLLRAFEVFHGRQAGRSDERYPDKLLEEESGHLRALSVEHEHRFIDAVAQRLAEAGVLRSSRRAGAGPRELAELLFATSLGLARRVATAAEYRDRMTVALRLVLADIEPPEPVSRRAVSNFPE